MRESGMRPAAKDEHQIFLSTVPARQVDHRLALIVISASVLIFIAAAPFSRVQLPVIWGFIPSYQSALAINDLITAVLLYAQLPILRSRALLLLASGYFFTALMTVVHALTFPGLFAPTGLLGAGAQSTAWLYMFWHGGFPLLVIGYALLNRHGGAGDELHGSAGRAIALSLAAVIAAVTGLTLIATAGHDTLPAIMAGRNYTPVMIGVVSSVWALSLVALLVLWHGRRHSVLDIWLMVVMCAWLFDIACRRAQRRSIRSGILCRACLWPSGREFRARRIAAGNRRALRPARALVRGRAPPGRGRDFAHQCEAPGTARFLAAADLQSRPGRPRRDLEPGRGARVRLH
jgi:hypothetical protein